MIEGVSKYRSTDIIIEGSTFSIYDIFPSNFFFFFIYVDKHLNNLNEQNFHQFFFNAPQ
jgi:hypothetical protein